MARVTEAQRTVDRLVTVEPLEKHYLDMRQTVGEGAYAAVTKHMKLKPDGKPVVPPHYVAVKTRAVQSKGMGFPHDVYREIKILSELQISYRSAVTAITSGPSRHGAVSSSSAMKKANSTGPAIQQPQHIVRLERVFVSQPIPGTPSIVSLVYSYAEHDLSHLIRHHRKTNSLMQPFVLKSVLAQVLSGLRVLHNNWIMHRDIKPQNVLIMGHGPQHGCVKVADFGLARIFQGLHEVRSLAADGDVVTIWYRAPELLLNAQHYTPAIDMWAVGCIFAEMLLRTPIFQGKEEKRNKGESVRFQKDQLQKIFEVLGKLTVKEWPLVIHCPFYGEIKNWESPRFQHRLAQNLGKLTSRSGLDLLQQMLHYDPMKRITADQALKHPFFAEEPLPNMNNAFLIPGSNKVFSYASQRSAKSPNSVERKVAMPQTQRPQLTGRHQSVPQQSQIESLTDAQQHTQQDPRDETRLQTHTHGPPQSDGHQQRPHTVSATPQQESNTDPIGGMRESSDGYGGRPIKHYKKR